MDTVLIIQFHMAKILLLYFKRRQKILIIKFHNMEKMLIVLFSQYNFLVNEIVG